MLDATTNFRRAFELLTQKGYKTYKLRIFDNGTGYVVCPDLQFFAVKFNGCQALPKVPADFMYFINVYDGFPALSYSFKGSLSNEQLFNKRLEVSEALLSWAEQLPSAGRVNRR